MRPGKFPHNFEIPPSWELALYSSWREDSSPDPRLSLRLWEREGGKPQGADTPAAVSPKAAPGTASALKMTPHPLSLGSPSHPSLQ